MNLTKLAFNTIWLMEIYNKDLARKTDSDKVLRDKAFNIAKNPKYDGYQRGLASMVYKFIDKKSKGSGFNMSLEFKKQLAKELHKLISTN